MLRLFFKLIILVLVLTQSVSGWAQETQETNPAPEATWVAPDIVSLQVDWWPQFISTNPEVFRVRSELLLAKVSEYVNGLDADSLVAAQTSVNTLSANLETISTLLEIDTTLQLEPLPTLENYTLQQLIDIRALWRDADAQLKVLELDQQQLSRQIDLLSQRRDLLLVQYTNTDINSPARILGGLRRVNLYLELYFYENQLKLKTTQQDQLNQYLSDATEKMEYASQHLYVAQLSLSEFDTTILDLNEDVIQAKSRVAVVQQKLLDVVNTDQPDAFVILDYKQQLTEVSAEELLSQLEVELEYAKRDWFLLRSGSAVSTHDLHMSDPLLETLIVDATQQADLWTQASQNTLITPAPENGRKARKSYELAQTTAHKTLSLIDTMESTVDNLTLIQNQVKRESLTLSRGLGGGWLRIKLIGQAIWAQSRGLFDASLFHIADRPVTASGLLKATIIFLLFWAISWLIRHFLDRLERRQHFEQGSFYAGGRVLHYVILTIAGIAALGSIGLDFSNFALIAGALSVGIGFGLQSVVLNFVSGLILLFEGSIRVGDYIQLDSNDAGPDLLGVVREIRSRATLINTNDNIDVIVPNAELVGNRMVNWTLRESIARMRIPFSVAYGSDKELVEKAALEAAAEGQFCIKHSPAYKPGIRLIEMGNNSLNFELRVWVNRQGVRRPIFVRSSILWVMDDKFREYGVRVPFPQRDLHFSKEFTVSQADGIDI